MIERKVTAGKRYMEGFELEHSKDTVSIGGGTIDSFELPSVEFELMYDSDMPILHDLYLIQDGTEYDYRLLATYMDGRTLAFYDQDGILFHRLMTIETRPDGTYSGDFVFIEEAEVKEDGYAEDSTPNSQEDRSRGR